MSEKSKTLIAAFLLLLSLVCATLGLIRNEDRTVENKSTNICMECIGIG